MDRYKTSAENQCTYLSKLIITKLNVQYRE